jgi:hypothetical protein
MKWRERRDVRLLQRWGCGELQPRTAVAMRAFSRNAGAINSAMRKTWRNFNSGF